MIPFYAGGLSATAQSSRSFVKSVKLKRKWSTPKLGGDRRASASRRGVEAGRRPSTRASRSRGATRIAFSTRTRARCPSAASSYTVAPQTPSVAATSRSLSNGYTRDRGARAFPWPGRNRVVQAQTIGSRALPQERNSVLSFGDGWPLSGRFRVVVVGGILMLLGCGSSSTSGGTGGSGGRTSGTGGSQAGHGGAAAGGSLPARLSVWEARKVARVDRSEVPAPAQAANPEA